MIVLGDEYGPSMGMYDFDGDMMLGWQSGPINIPSTYYHNNQEDDTAFPGMYLGYQGNTTWGIKLEDGQPSYYSARLIGHEGPRKGESEAWLKIVGQ